jgi:hypothetical protein
MILGIYILGVVVTFVGFITWLLKGDAKCLLVEDIFWSGFIAIVWPFALFMFGIEVFFMFIGKHGNKVTDLISKGWNYEIYCSRKKEDGN